MKIFEPFFHLMNAGGSVLWILLFLALILVMLIVERNFFYKKEFGKFLEIQLEKLKNVNTSVEWRSLYEREILVSELKSLLRKRLSLIQAITYLCPLFGLLGTVTGMIAVFDVMAFKGLGNPRLMASGVSQATLPTMVSMILAIVGLVGGNYLQSKKKKLELEVSEKFQLEKI